MRNKTKKNRTRKKIGGMNTVTSYAKKGANLVGSTLSGVTNIIGFSSEKSKNENKLLIPYNTRNLTLEYDINNLSFIKGYCVTTGITGINKVEFIYDARETGDHTQYGWLMFRTTSDPFEIFLKSIGYSFKRVDIDTSQYNPIINEAVKSKQKYLSIKIDKFIIDSNGKIMLNTTMNRAGEYKKRLINNLTFFITGFDFKAFHTISCLN